MEESNIKKVAVIGIVGIPAKYGGFETMVEHLIIYLSNKFDITVFCSSKAYSQKITHYNGSTLIYLPLKANGLQSVIYDIFAILKSLKFADTLLILGVSGCIILPFIKPFSRKKLVVNVDGLEWKREKWGKFEKLFLKLSEKFAVRFADVIIADNKAIQHYIKKEYGVNSVFISYGADHVKKEILNEELESKYSFLKNKYALKVCRIEPENNIHLILETFSKYKELNIVIIGNWENSIYGKKLKNKYSNIANIFLLDPIYDQTLLNQIRSNCYLYIHGHSAGGTNPSLVEAMYLGLPIIAFDVEYNRYTTNNKAFYFKDSNDLLDILKSIHDEDLKKNGNNMHKFASENYIWEIIAKKYDEILS